MDYLEEARMKTIYSEEHLLNDDPEKTAKLLETATQLINKMVLEGFIDYEQYLELFQNSREISNSAEQFNIIHGIMLKEHDTNPDNAIANASISALVAAILEIVYLRKVARNAIKDKVELRNLLDMVCEKEHKNLH